MEREIVIEQFEHYQKRSFRNKCMIANAQGIQTLTVPLKRGKHEQQPITEVQIAYDEPWIKNHLRSIVSAYGSSPYFEHYFPQLEDLYASAESSLFQFNWSIINHFRKILNAKEVQRSASFEKNTKYEDRRGLSLLRSYREMAPGIKYSQVFEDRHGFLPNLSILDLIFCTGPAAAQYLLEGAGRVHPSSGSPRIDSP